jgi:NAD-dependent deacetylase
MHHPVDGDELDSALERAAALLRAAGAVAVLTGAGVSAESGLATFRGAGGLWEGHRVEDVGTPRAFQRDPALVWRFYNQRRADLRVARPNPGHYALAALEDHFAPGRFTLATQNVDGLHRAAGSSRVLELHGSLARVRCTGCTFSQDRGAEQLDDLPRCPTCRGLLRPGVVWFYEPLPEAVWQEAERAAEGCDCFLVVGTSAVVYPAAGLVEVARERGAAVIEVNLEPTAASCTGDVGLYGPSGQLLPQLVQRLGEGPGERGASAP